MEEKEDSRLEMVPLTTAESLDVDFRTSSALIALAERDELDSVERGLAYSVERVEGSTNLAPAAADQRPVEKLDNGHPKEVTKEFVSRDLVRVQKTESNEVISREAFLSESRASFIQNDSVGRGVGLISDEDFEREFGASASGGSGQSTPKRRNGSRGRSTGVSRLENGVGGEVLRGSIIDALRANAAVSPRSRNSSSGGGGKDLDIPFSNFDEVVVPEPRSPSRNPVFGTIFKTLFYICMWYAFSLCLTLYNKYLLGEDFGKFPAPLLMNTIHFSMQATISSLIVRFSCCGINPSHIRMTWRDYFGRVVPTAVSTALDIDLSNISLVFISVSFATMVKSGTPIFLLLFAFVFKLEVPSFKLLGIILVISFGVMLTVAKETEFEVRGFILVLLATVMSGFRWTLTQLLLQAWSLALYEWNEISSWRGQTFVRRCCCVFSIYLISVVVCVATAFVPELWNLRLKKLQKEEYGLSNPFAAMSYLTPVMAIITLIISLFTEPWHELGETAYFDTSRHVFESCALMLLGGALAFFMVMTEYFLVAETSAVTLTIAGVVKEVVTIVGAVFIFHDEFTWLKAVGLVVIFIGVGLFNWFKYQKLIEGGLGNIPSQQDGTRSPGHYVIINDEADGTSEHGDDGDHVL